jgi:hypothetical protein
VSLAIDFDADRGYRKPRAARGRESELGTAAAWESASGLVRLANTGASKQRKADNSGRLRLALGANGHPVADTIIDFAPDQTFGSFSYPDATTTSKGIVQIDATGGITVYAGAIGLANSGVTPSTCPKVTVHAKGRVTAGAVLTGSDLPSELQQSGSYQTIGGAFENMAKYSEDFSAGVWDRVPSSTCKASLAIVNSAVPSTSPAPRKSRSRHPGSTSRSPARWRPAKRACGSWCASTPPAAMTGRGATSTSGAPASSKARTPRGATPAPGPRKRHTRTPASPLALP